VLGFTLKTSNLALSSDQVNKLIDRWHSKGHDNRQIGHKLLVMVVGFLKREYFIKEFFVIMVCEHGEIVGSMKNDGEEFDLSFRGEYFNKFHDAF
jgi:hypothetical protein